MRLRFSTSVWAPSSEITPSANGLRASAHRAGSVLCMAGALVSTLSMLGCEDNYITNKYYLSDAAVTAPDTSDAATTDTEDASAPTDPTPTDPELDSGLEPADAGEPPEQDAGPEEPPLDDDAGSVDAGEPEPERPFMEGAPEANTDVAAFEVDVFGTIGNRYWFAADPAQVDKMNGNQGGGPIIFNEFGDIYEPPGEGGKPAKTYVESLFVTTPEGNTADFGQLSVRVFGQSTHRPWTATTIPNLRLDFDHFTKGQRIDGYEHIRFNNGLVGSIFREKLTLDLYRKLGYPAPMTQFAWVGSNIWGPDAWIPYTVVEVYKKSFCAKYSEEFGGGCENMWEYYGDFGQGIFEDPNNCQSDECDNTRVKELEEAVMSAPYGDGFKASLEEMIDWESFHEFQCLSWVLAVGDDALHNFNNVLLIERSDGKFQFFPYSTDISLGQDWYPQVPLAGTNTLAMGCQNEASCWADTVATCERIVADFTALEPGKLLDEEYAALEAEGMLRNGDEDRYAMLSQWFEDRLLALPVELEENRESPQICSPGQMWCESYCTEPEFCHLCQPPVGEPPVVDPGPRPIPLFAPAAIGDAGVADASAADAVVIAPVPLPVPEGDGGVIDEPPNMCPPMEVYKLAQ
jgi:CotH kinase protein